MLVRVSCGLVMLIPMIQTASVWVGSAFGNDCATVGWLLPGENSDWYSRYLCSIDLWISSFMKLIRCLVGSFSIAVHNKLIASATGLCFSPFLAGLVGTNNSLLSLPDLSKLVSSDEPTSTYDCAEGSAGVSSFY